MIIYFITAMMMGPLESFSSIIAHTVFQEIWQLVRRFVEFDWIFDMILRFVKNTEEGHREEQSGTSKES